LLGTKGDVVKKKKKSKKAGVAAVSTGSSFTRRKGKEREGRRGVWVLKQQHLKEGKKHSRNRGAE